jgi:hypothetical protein
MMKHMTCSLVGMCALTLGTACLAADIAPAVQPPTLTPQEVQEGFVSIFNGKNLKGWVGIEGKNDSYYVKDGMLICKDTGKEHLFTEKEYANFVLRLEIKLDSGSNNGIGVRDQISRKPHLEGNELQVLDDTYYPCWKHGHKRELKDYQHHGSLYGVLPAKTGHLKPVGEWNEQEIVCDGRHLKVTLNGSVILDCDLDKVQPIDGQEHPGLKYAAGHIGLHAHGNHGAEVFFRNLRIKELK